MSRHFCTGCGNALSVNAHFCAVCGQKKSNDEGQPEPEKRCLNCGMTHSSSASFCKNCGTGLKTPYMLSDGERVCSFCGSQIPPSSVFCTACGSKIPTAETEKPIKNDNSKTSAEGYTDHNPAFRVKEKAALYPPKTIKSRPVRRFPILIITIILGAAVVFAGIYTAYLNGLLKNPFSKQIPFDPDSSVYNSADWENSPDLKKEQDAIVKRQRELISNLEKNNIKKAVKYFFPDIQSEWQKKLEDDPDGTAVLAEVLATAEMTFLGQDNKVKEDPRGRAASFLVKYDQKGFFITWIKYEGVWYLYDF